MSGRLRSKRDPLPARLRAVRILRGITQQDMADLLKTSRNTVTRWEGGTMSFHPAMRERVEKWVKYWENGEDQSDA